MAVRTRQRYCETCAQLRPFDKPAPNHVLHLLLSCITFGLWLIIWLPATIANSLVGKSYCRTCGGQPSSLRMHGKPPQRILLPLALLLWGLLAAFGGVMIWVLGRPAPPYASPKSAMATTKADVAPVERPRASMEVWPTLLSTYPELRGDRLQWRDISGMTYVAVPDPFWNALSSSQRRSLANDLDSVLKTTTWTIATGRYVGNGKMMLDVNRTRWAVLAEK